MSIVVYWSFLEDEWMRCKEPQNVQKLLYSKKIHTENSLTNFHQCPFSASYLNNTYSLHSPYDYSFVVEDSSVTSNAYDQIFFDSHVRVRSTKNNFFSFSMPFIFFTEEKSLEMTIPMFPFLEDNNITKRCIPFTGTIDIGKYFRATDFAFLIRDNYNEFLIEQGEVFGYIKFNTDKKITFKQFYPSDQIKKYSGDTKRAVSNKKFRFENPVSYYNNFKIKNLVLEEIKKNLL